MYTDISLVNNGVSPEALELPRQPDPPTRRLRGLRRPAGTPASDIGRPDITVVVPTRGEAGNVHELIRRLDLALGDIRAEILFVDDSDDDTPEAIRSAAANFKRTVRLLHREPGQREGRLGGAVV